MLKPSSGWLLLLVAVTCLSCSPSNAAEPKKQRLLLVATGPDGHPKSTHEYVAGLTILQRSLRDVPNLDTTLVKAEGDWAEGPDAIKNADAVVLFVSEGAKWVQAEPRRLEALSQLTARGGGIMALHWAIGTKAPENILGFQKLLGGCHGGPDRKYQVTEAEVSPAHPAHPIAANMAPFQIRDEFYYRIKFLDNANIQPVLTVPIDGQTETIAWAWSRPDGGRSFGFSGLHFHPNWKSPEYRRLVSQAALWIAKLPVPEKAFPVALDESDFELK